jgi:hypothetical protein
MNNQAPREGEGLHQWLLMESRDLLVQGVPFEDALDRLLQATRDSGRTTQDVEEEITNALEGAREFLEENPNWRAKGSRANKWVDPLSFVGLNDMQSRRDRRTARLPVDVTLQKRVFKKVGGLDKRGLKGIEDYGLPLLYGNKNFLLCVTIEQSRKPLIVPLEELEDGKAKFQYLVPNPLRDVHYGRCDFGTGERLFMVVEFDEADFMEQIAYLIHLERSTRFPLVMVVFSGNKSYHGWFACFGQTEYKCKTLSRRATQLGADRTTYSPSQYVRMPEGWNYKHGTKQEVIYFNEEKLGPQNALIEGEF